MFTLSVTLHDNARTMGLFVVHAVSFRVSLTEILFVWPTVREKSACDCVCAQKMSNMVAELGEWAGNIGYGDDRTTCGVGPADDAMSQRGGVHLSRKNLISRSKPSTEEFVCKRQVSSLLIVLCIIQG